MERIIRVSCSSDFNTSCFMPFGIVNSREEMESFNLWQL